MRDNTISKTRFIADEIRDLPVTDVESVIDLSAGVYRDIGGCVPPLSQAGFVGNTGCGFIVRGGRPTESATFVDGMLVTDFNTQRAGFHQGWVSQFLCQFGFRNRRYCERTDTESIGITHYPATILSA